MSNAVIRSQPVRVARGLPFEWPSLAGRSLVELPASAHASLTRHRGNSAVTVMDPEVYTDPPWCFRH